MKTLFAVLCFLSGFYAFSQTPLRTLDLGSRKPSWQAVIGGEAVSECAETSYGLAVVSDGRLLSACTNNGNIIWQRAIKGRPSKYIASSGDFLYVVTDFSRLSLVNPSGITIWQVTCPFNISSFPLPGRDGRVFVRGDKGIASYGLDGKRKWYFETEELSAVFPVSELNDGSVLVYLSRTKDGHSIAKRFSSFGEELEDLTFSGIIQSVENTEEGTLVSLTNGSIGLIAAGKDGKADSKWVTSSGFSSGAFSITYRAQTHHASFFFQDKNGTQAVIVNVSDGKETARFSVGNIDVKGFKGAKASSSGFFISGSYSACEFYEDGTILWSAVLPPVKNWTSLCYTGENNLIFCFNDWSISSYKMNSLPSAAVYSPKMKIESLAQLNELDSSSKAIGMHSLTDEKMNEITGAIKAEDTGKKEKEYLSLIKAESFEYLNTLSSLSNKRSENYYEENPSYTVRLFYLMSKTGTGDFSSVFADILLKETDPYLLSEAVLYSGEEGFDPDGEILNAYEYIALHTDDTKILLEISDATYKVCRFMGRPAFNRQGKNILSRLMFPQYDKQVKEHARKTLEKMIKLEKGSSKNFSF